MRVSNSQQIFEASRYIHYRLAISLIGIAMVQTHSYYINYPKDWMFQKVAVSFVVASINQKNILTAR